MSFKLAGNKKLKDVCFRRTFWQNFRRKLWKIAGRHVTRAGRSPWVFSWNTIILFRKFPWGSWCTVLWRSEFQKKFPSNDFEILIGITTYFLNGVTQGDQDKFPANDLENFKGTSLSVKSFWQFLWITHIYWTGTSHGGKLKKICLSRNRPDISYRSLASYQLLSYRHPYLRGKQPNIWYNEQ